MSSSIKAYVFLSFFSNTANGCRLPLNYYSSFGAQFDKSCICRLCRTDSRWDQPLKQL